MNAPFREDLVEFGLLGPLAVRAGGSPVVISAGKQRVLLAALLLHANQVVPAAELAGRRRRPGRGNGPRSSWARRWSCGGGSRWRMCRRGRWPSWRCRG